MLTLKDLCKQVLSLYANRLDDVGDVPYDLVKESLFSVAPEQLVQIEQNSPHIAISDQEIWLHFINNEFPTTEVDVNSSKYKSLYFDLVQDRKRRMEEAGGRLKDKYASLKNEKMKRQLVVLEKPPTQPLSSKKQPPRSTSKGTSLIRSLRNDSKKNAQRFRSTAFQSDHLNHLRTSATSSSSSSASTFGKPRPISTVPNPRASKSFFNLPRSSTSSAARASKLKNVSGISNKPTSTLNTLASSTSTSASRSTPSTTHMSATSPQPSKPIPSSAPVQRQDSSSFTNQLLKRKRLDSESPHPASKSHQASPNTNSTNSNKSNNKTSLNNSTSKSTSPRKSIFLPKRPRGR